MMLFSAVFGEGVGLIWERAQTGRVGSAVLIILEG